jgi:hypothetical protein
MTISSLQERAAVGQLAKEYTGKRLPLQVLRSAAGYYLGTADDEGPCSRESVEYWPAEGLAQSALAQGHWTQRDTQ